MNRNHKPHNSMMWAVSLIPPSPFLTKPTGPPLCPFVLTVSRSAIPLYDGVCGGLGHTIIGAANFRNSSSDSSIPKQQKQKQGDKTQLSGSDVLRALEKAAVKKRKKLKKTRELSPADGGKADDDNYVDYSNVKPLCIKPQWAVKLDELEKRFQELSEIN